MLHSKLFLKTKKEAPSDEVAKNAQLLIRAGYIYKEMAGVYAYLPTGLRVIEKIKKIAREEMNKYGGQEMQMTTLQSKELWEKTDRWNSELVDIWFKSKLNNGSEVGFGWSHEEPFVNMMAQYVQSYKDLPVYVYQFQQKLRNEERAKSGIMRGREFLMKDLYSFTKDNEDHEKFYKQMIEAYINFYKRIGIGEETFLVAASGGAFTQNISHEFQTITDAGEDIIYVDRKSMTGVNSEVIEDELALQKVGLAKENLEKVKTSEVGNIFSFGGEKSEKLGLHFSESDGTKKPVILGSYGIGITRVMGVLVEKFGDDKGLVWPKAVAPFDIEIISLHKEKTDEIFKASKDIYEKLEKNFEVLLDDREASVGVKLNDADLYGIPMQIIVGHKGLERGVVEVKLRKTGEIVELNANLGREEFKKEIESLWQKVF